VFSRTFRVAHNSINGPYFKGVFNVNSTDFDAGIKSDAYILDNGQLFTRGNIRLINVFNNNADGSIEYEILFTGETSDFGAKIGGGFLNELDFTEYNHERNLVNIQKSWDLDLFAGDLVYGLIEWGYTYDKNNRPDIPTLSNGFEKSFTSSLNPLLTSQWKPQFRAKAIWDKVFENVGYTYDSAFLNSELFKKMYVITENKAEGAVSNANGAEATSSYVQYMTIGSSYKVNFTTEVLDNGNNYDPGTSTYNIPATGSYTAAITLNVGSGTNSGSANFSVAGTVSAVDANTNQTLASQGYYVNVGSQTIPANLTFNATAGQQIIIKISSTCATGTGCSNGITEFRIYSGRLVYVTQSDIFSINSIMPNNVRTIDFMRSIINRFRLVFVPSKEKTNHFTITPWKDWILQGEAIDWTNKVTGFIDAKSSPIFYTQNRFNVFKDQEDSDYLNYDYQLQYKQTFGQLNLDSVNELITGTKTYQDQFAAAPLAPIGFKEGDTQAPKFVIPHIAKDTGASQDAASGSPIVGKREPVQPKLRLVFYNGLRQAPLTWYSKDYSGGAQAQTTYPLMSQYSEFPVTATTLDLCWANVAPYWDTEISELGNGITANTSFTTYWKSWYDTTFDPYSRLSELEVQLDYSDLINFKFNDYVFIENSWYFVNEIKDYIVGQNTLCKVQLIKVGNNIGITLPLVVENQLTEISLCKAATACDAYCCKDYTGAQSNTYWINGIDLFEATAIYIDNAGSQFAPAGIYSDGMTALELNGVGSIESRPDVSGCNCTPVSYPYTTERVLTEPCNLYCQTNPTVVVYSASNTFADSTYFFLDAALTIPATTGYYAIVGGLTALQVGANGQVLVTVSLADCNCVTYYPHVTCYSGALCDACCCYNEPTTVYTNNVSLASSTLMWLDNAGASPAPIGYYKESSSAVARITTAGVISAIDTCVGCAACDAGPVQVTYGIGGSEPGYISTATLEKSFDNINWIEVGTLTFTNGGDVQDTVGLEEGVYVRATFTSTVNNGDLYTYYYVNGQTVFYNINDTPGSRTIYSTGTITAANLYQLSGYVSGGDPAPISGGIRVSGYFSEYKDGEWPSIDGGAIGSLLGLDNDANINTEFDVKNGILGSLRSENVCNSVTDGSSIFVAVNKVYAANGNLYYKNTPILDAVVKINLNGELDTVFSTNYNKNISSVLSPPTKVFIANNKLFSTNAFVPRILCTDFNGVTDASFTSPTFGSSNDTITDIIFYNNFYYVFGSFTTVGGSTYNRIVVLNLNGSVNATESAKFGTAFNGEVLTASLYNTTLVVGGSFTTYKGLASSKLVALDITTGNVASGFSVGTGLTDGTVTTIKTDDSGIYVGITQTTSTEPRYKFAFINNVFKIDYSASLIPTFNTGLFVDNNLTYVDVRINNITIDGSNLLITGFFKNVNNVLSSGLIKVNATDGSRISTFNVDLGFGKPDINVTPASVNTALVISGSVYVTGFFQTYKGSESNNIIKLDNTATRQIDFNIEKGFRLGDINGTFGVLSVPNIASDSTGNVYTVVAYGNNSQLAFPTNYKENKTNKRIIKLSNTGIFNSTFDNNFPLKDVSWIDIINDKLYTDGINGTIPQDLYIRRYNLDGTVDATWSLNTPDSSTVPTVNDVILHNNLLYFAGYWKNSSQPTPTGAYTPVFVFNLDGTFNATETNKFVKFSGGGATTGRGTGLAINNGILYLVGEFRPNYDGVACGNIIAADLTTGNRVSAFNQDTGFGTTIPSSIVTDGTSLYVSNVTTYKGLAVDRIVNLDFNGNKVGTFAPGTFNATSGITLTVKSKLLGSKLYAYGTFSGLNATTSSGLIALDKNNGSIISSFNVGSGFKPIVGFYPNIVSDILYKESETITTYEINTSYSIESSCVAYCDATYNNTVYGNGNSLISSTILYSDATGTTYASTGWYSDGGSIAQIDGNGIIIGYTNINTCVCNTLYPFDILYDADECTSCGLVGIPDSFTVWGVDSNWSTNAILYADSLGSTFASSGWYSYNNNIALQVGTNGVVQNIGDCSVDCGISENCVTLRVLNTSGGTLDYSYEYCGGGGITYGTMFDGEILFTSCMVQGSFQASGSYLIQQTIYC
jgi:hypothetical protein